MTIPAWIPDCFAAIVLAVAAVGAGRLIAACLAGRQRADCDVDAAHVLMGVAMGGMVVSSLRILPGAAWAVTFSVITAWFAWQVSADALGHGISALGTGHRLPHLVHAAAMVYMSAAGTGETRVPVLNVTGKATGASAVGALRAPTLGLAFAVFMAAWAIWDLDQIGTARLRVHPARAAPGLAARGRLAVVPARTGPAGACRPGGAECIADLAAAGRLPSWLSDPAVAVGCRIAMGVTMAFTLVIML